LPWIWPGHVSPLCWNDEQSVVGEAQPDAVAVLAFAALDELEMLAVQRVERVGDERERPSLV